MRSIVIEKAAQFKKKDTEPLDTEIGELEAK